MTELYLGTQGWSYKDWVGSFYRDGTQARDYLAQYARVFNAVELDTTFYGTPTASRVEGWKSATPDDFCFTAKVPRSITHDKHLQDADDEMDAFLDVMSTLEPKLGSILVQLPPDFSADERPHLQRFLERLPRDASFAVEFRHRSWLTEETVALLTDLGMAWTCIDLSFMPKSFEVTADFMYVRWLGNRQQIQQMDHVQIDRRPELDAWVERIESELRRVERIFGFVNNHYSGHSPADVRYLRRKLGMPDPITPPELEQGTLL
jgi:uncharacterized protein YecE (DUF72 family)